MRLVKRIGLIVLSIIGLLVLVLVSSVVVDRWLDRGRIDALVNTWIENPNGPAVGAFVAQPRGDGPHPAVIMIHEFWGMKPAINGKAAALAAEGYVVVAPDTYRSQVTNWIPRAIYLAMTTDAAQVNTDLDAVFHWLAAQPAVDPNRIMVMGFCYGGGKALEYSLHNDRVAATGIFYGSLITDPTKLQKLPGPVLGIFGEADQGIPIAEVQTFQQALNTAGVTNQITIYPGQGHAFVESIEGIRAGGAQGEAWQEFLTFLAKNL
ncbi:MAG: dienelactone hydrolase family protein [Caldilinea sp. CFX5]|nr:dienelactone hydrolase family protein [Caldilinea sp. CFX5]